MTRQREQFMNTNRLPQQPLFDCAKFAGMDLNVIKRAISSSSNISRPEWKYDYEWNRRT